MKIRSGKVVVFFETELQGLRKYLTKYYGVYHTTKINKLKNTTIVGNNLPAK